MKWGTPGPVQAEGTVRTLLTILTARFGEIPGEVISHLESTQDLTTLRNWARTAATADSLERSAPELLQ